MFFCSLFCPIGWAQHAESEMLGQHPHQQSQASVRRQRWDMVLRPECLSHPGPLPRPSTDRMWLHCRTGSCWPRTAAKHYADTWTSSTSQQDQEKKHCQFIHRAAHLCPGIITQACPRATDFIPHHSSHFLPLVHLPSNLSAFLPTPDPGSLTLSTHPLFQALISPIPPP